MERAEVHLGGGWRGCWGFARLLVLLPGNFLAGGEAEVAGFAPCASFYRSGVANVAPECRWNQHGLNLDQLGLVVLHVLDERASGVVGAED